MRYWDWLRERIARESRGLALSLWANAGLLLFAAAAMPFDQRRILGLNPWVKPMKFDISVIVYLATVAVLLSLLRGWERPRRLIGWGIGVAMIVEDTIISLQSLRGVQSHMNYTSLFNGVAFGVMGMFILLNTALLAWLLALYCVRKTALPPAVAWGIRLGLAAVLIGSIEGALMVQLGGHTVGAADGLAGLPFVNWSRGHGDLRVPHFFALHALQALPLVGWGWSRTRFPAWAQCTGTAGVAAVYGAGVWLLFAQAMAGRPAF